MPNLIGIVCFNVSLLTVLKAICNIDGHNCSCIAACTVANPDTASFHMSSRRPNPDNSISGCMPAIRFPVPAVSCGRLWTSRLSNSSSDLRIEISCAWMSPEVSSSLSLQSLWHVWEPSGIVLRSHAASGAGATVPSICVRTQNTLRVRTPWPQVTEHIPQDAVEYMTLWPEGVRSPIC